MEKIRKISVTGEGRIHVEPDVTRIELSLNSVHDSYEEAYEQTKSNVDKLHKIMEEVGLPVTQPKTVRLDIDKKMVNEYDKYKNYIGEKMAGFELKHTVKIDLGMDNVILNSIIRSVGRYLKQAEINIGYTVKDARLIQLKILERAVKDAKAKAEVMAAASGCRLGNCIAIDYGVNEIHIYSQARTIHESEADYCTADSLDITPDDLGASDTVDVQWELINE